jgi:hypothetical protein
MDCGLMEQAMTQLASQFMKIKFLKIRSTSAVENWPESNLPTIFAYHDGELQHQLFTLKSIGGSSMTSDGASLPSPHAFLLVSLVPSSPVLSLFFS